MAVFEVLNPIGALLGKKFVYLSVKMLMLDLLAIVEFTLPEKI